MAKAYKDMTNKRFGKLVAKKCIIREDHVDKYFWECYCDCGKKHITSGYVLRSGKAKSCGCEAGRSRIKDRKEKLIKDLYRDTIVKRSKKLNFDIYIDYELFKKTIFEECYYCGKKSSKIVKDLRIKEGKKIIITDEVLNCNGIDRIDSNLGYIDGNITACCTHCNMAKNNLTQKDFFNLVKNIYNNYIK